MDVRAPVAAVIPCYNSSEYVAEAIESALTQTYPAVDVVVVNDGSTDGFNEAVRPYRHRIRIVEQENRGLAGARNAGIDATTTPFIAFLDADDRWHRDKIARQVAYLESHPETSLVFCDRSWIDTGGSPIEAPAYRRPVVPSLRALLDGNFIQPSTVLLRRDVLGPDRFAAGMQGTEDWDLWLRLAERCEFAYIEEPLVEYRVHQLNMSAGGEGMMRGFVTVLTRAIARGLPHDLHSVAERYRRGFLEALAHCACDRDDWTEARRLFEESGFQWSPRAAPRYVLTLLPSRVREVARGAKARVSPLLGHR